MGCSVSDGAGEAVVSDRRSDSSFFCCGSLVCGGVVPAACGVAGMKKTEGALSLAIVAVVGAFIGAVAYRVLMWTASIALMSLFGVSI